MKNLIILAIVVFLSMVGCSQKGNFFSKDLSRENSLMHTKKGEIYNSLEIKATIIATRLNEIVKQYKKSKNEVFLVALYIDKDLQQKNKSGIYNPDIELTLNGEKPFNIVALKQSDELVSYAPLVNSWSKYYVVEFKDAKEDALKMTLTSHKYGETKLVFNP